MTTRRIHQTRAQHDLAFHLGTYAASHALAPTTPDEVEVIAESRRWLLDHHPDLVAEIERRLDSLGRGDVPLN